MVTRMLSPLTGGLILSGGKYNCFCLMCKYDSLDTWSVAADTAFSEPAGRVVVKESLG
jgi:hypothetical protein